VELNVNNWHIKIEIAIRSALSNLSVRESPLVKKANVINFWVAVKPLIIELHRPAGEESKTSAHILGFIGVVHDSNFTKDSVSLSDSVKIILNASFCTNGESRNTKSECFFIMLVHLVLDSVLIEYGFRKVVCNL